jgi:antitoxin (DNA-binding transcriptional repressor) of toxin-antitoxin stability system
LCKRLNAFAEANGMVLISKDSDRRDSQSMVSAHEGDRLSLAGEARDVHLCLHFLVHREAAMKQANFTEVRNHAKTYFDMVESGETVRVLRNGKPIADIVPVAAGLPSWKRRKAQPLVLDGVSVSRMILDERDAGV